MKDPDAIDRIVTSKGSVLDVALTFLRLGCISFGGPVAHLGYLHREIVAKRRWLEDAQYTDLVALCQFLPGPASSQVVFALGMRRAGFWGAVAASLGFTLPSAVLMIAFAKGVAHLDPSHATWLRGMKVAALAVVAQAVWRMGQKLCADKPRLSLCAAAAVTLLVLPGTGTQLLVILLGGLLGFIFLRTATREGTQSPSSTRTHRSAVIALALYLALLVLLPIVAARVPSPELATVDSYYRSGALVFGGGHVVLPLLRAEVVPPGWVTDEQFLAGYGAAQALPGPLFAFAAYLGTVSAKGGGWEHGLLSLFALFLPGWLLIGGALPFWDRLRSLIWVNRALIGANAAVVGVLLASLYSPVFVESVHGPRHLALALAAFVLLEQWATPPWVVVGGTALVGHWVL